MGYFHFRRSIRILPGLRINIGKRGVSTSIGVRGAHVTVGHGKVRETVGIPGSGISYSATQSTRQTRDEAPSEAQTQPVADVLPKGRAWRGWLSIAVLLAIVVAIALNAGCAAPPAQHAISNQERLANIERVLDSWNGRNVNDLIGNLGPPTSTFAMPNGNTMYTFTRTWPMPDLNGGSVTLYCTVHYVVDRQSQAVIGHSREGC
jgi:hypothetical protein